MSARTQEDCFISIKNVDDTFSHDFQLKFNVSSRTPMSAKAELADTPRSAFYTFQEVLINRHHRTGTHSCFPLTNSLMTVL